MKKIVIMLLILPIMLSCMLYAEPPLDESDFPLKQVLVLPVDGDIQGIAVADTWVVVHTYDKIIAMDIDTQKTLWSMDFQVITPHGKGFLMNNDTLIAASFDQIIVVNKLGEKKEINLDPDTKTITKILGVYSNYLYVVGGSEWTFAVYDISKNIMLWKMFVEREISDVVYDVSNNVVYVPTFSLRAFDNLSGKLLWEMGGIGAIGDSEVDILYVFSQTNIDNSFGLAAIDTVNQKKFWEKDIAISSSYSVSNLTIIDNLLIISGSELLAINKSNGEQVWATASVGEEFYTPVEYDGVIYVKTGATGSVYAISPDDGAVIGHVRLEDIGFGVANGGVYKLKDGIVFNTRNAIVIYKAK